MRRSALATNAFADEPMAQIQWVDDKALRETIQRALTLSKHPAQSRAEARRRARQAGEDAIAVRIAAAAVKSLRR